MGPVRQLDPDAPSTLPVLILDLTTACDSRCITCDFWQAPRRHMSLQLMERLAEEMKGLGVELLVLSGGEPLQHPEWTKAARLGRAAGADVMLVTNGLLLEHSIDQVAELCDLVVVSLDGATASTYEAIRGVRGLRRVVDGMASMHARGVTFITRTTVQSANFRELAQIVDLARSRGASGVSFLPVDVANRQAFGRDTRGVSVETHRWAAARDARCAKAALSGPEIAELRAILEDLGARSRVHSGSSLIVTPPAKMRWMADYFEWVASGRELPRRACNAPHVSTVVEADGRLRPCFFLPTWGVVDDRPLEDVINTEAAVTLRRECRQGARSECTGCGLARTYPDPSATPGLATDEASCLSPMKPG